MAQRLAEIPGVSRVMTRVIAEATLDLPGTSANRFYRAVGPSPEISRAAQIYAAVSAFVSEVAKNPLPHVDLRGAGFEVHLRKDHLLDGVTSPYGLATRKDGSQVMVDYKGDLGLLLGDFRDNYLAPEYSMAGFAPPGKTLATTLSADVQAICQSLGWACTDPSIHARQSIQHANYDQYAACGDGCSGNPFDADWSIMPLGWGESHELGHNLQKSLLQIGYVAAADHDDHRKYQGRATENSNNIFPYHNLYRYVREVRGEQSRSALTQASRRGVTSMPFSLIRMTCSPFRCARPRSFATSTRRTRRVSKPLPSPSTKPPSGPDSTSSHDVGDHPTWPTRSAITDTPAIGVKSRSGS